MSILGRVGAGVATGGLSEIANGLFPGQTTTQEALMSPEQRAGQDLLLKLARTGQFGDFKAGAAVPLGYGDYQTTAPEQQGLSRLQDLLQNGIPQNFRLADQALAGMLNPDPAATAAQFDPFKAQVERQISGSNAALKRAAGFGGNLYSTNTIKGLGDIQARGNETLTAKLADLANAAMDRRLAAVGAATNLGTAEQNATLGQVAASQQYGDLTRSLNDAAIKARDAELLRRRQELLIPIQAATTLAGANTQFGVPSVTVSPYQQLLQMAGQVGGKFLGSYAGAAGASLGGA